MAPNQDVPKTETAKKQALRTLRQLQEVIVNLSIGILLVLVVTIIERTFSEETMQTKSARNTFFWAWGCLIALFVLGWANKCAFGQNVPVFYGALAPHIQGQTVCDKAGNMAIILNSQIDATDTVHVAIVIRHEMVHVKQITAIGNCEDAGTEYKKNPLLKEIPAYCEELRKRMVEGDAAKVLDEFVTYMTAYYGVHLKLDYRAVLKLTNEFCLKGG